jgi:enterochelin esterase family protein
LIDGEGWQSVVSDKMFVDAPCSDAEGNFYFSDLGGNTGLYKVTPDGTVSVFNKDATGISGMKWGPDGRLYACHNREKRIIAIDSAGNVEVLATDIGCNDLVVNHKGHIYVTVTGKKQIVLIEGAGKMRVVDTGIDKPNGLTLSPDQQTLAVSDYGGSAVWALRVEPNGDLTAKMPVMPFRSFGGVVEGKGDGMTCDTRSRWYCSSVSGVQVFDPNGRPAGLILPPVDTPITSVTLSGPGLSYLYLLSKGQIFKRKVNASGLLSYKEPMAMEK